MNQDDLVALCKLFHTCEREKEALETLRELIEYDPVFDKDRRNLFHAIYKQTMDSLRSVLYLCRNYHDFEVTQGNERHAAMLEEKREKNCEKLLSHVKDGIDVIDQSLLPNAADTEATVFFQQMKGDFYRYVAEYSDESESITAANNAEEAYRVAVELADGNLPRLCRLRMGLLLSVAVFRYEIKDEATAAAEMLMACIDEFEKARPQLSDQEIRDVHEIVDIMRDNLDAWGCADKA